MSERKPLSGLWNSIQSWLLPFLEDEIGELDPLSPNRVRRDMRLSAHQPAGPVQGVYRQGGLELRHVPQTVAQIAKVSRFLF